MSESGLAVQQIELPKPLHWTINGERREAIVIVPKGPRNQPAPLVFFFHGHGQNMEKVAQRSRIPRLWPEAVVVFMQGLPTPSRVDPKGKKAGWQSQAGTMGDRDLKFVDAVLKTVHEKHAIDDDRVYSAGTSNGGGFTYVLWTARPEIFAAYAPCAAMLHLRENMTLKPGAVLHIAGQQDRTCPFTMQQETMAKVREVNGCKETSVDWGNGCKLYPPQTKSGAPFVSYIHPGGHGAPPHTAELSVKFFKEHPRKSSTTDAAD
jgi:polyhydroxybutyrate depolymerase